MAKYTVIRSTKELTNKMEYAITHSSIEGLKENVPLTVSLVAVVELRIEPTANDDFDAFNQYILVTDKGMYSTGSEALMQCIDEMARAFGEEFEGTTVYIHYRQSKKNTTRKYLVADIVMD